MERKRIIIGDRALVEEIMNDDATYKYWVYCITPVVEGVIDGVKITTGGHVLFDSMFRTLDEALERFERI